MSLENGLGIPVPLTGTALKIVSSDGTEDMTRGPSMIDWHVGGGPCLTNNILDVATSYSRDLAWDSMVGSIP